MVLIPTTLLGWTFSDILYYLLYILLLHFSYVVPSSCLAETFLSRDIQRGEHSSVKRRRFPSELIDVKSYSIRCLRYASLRGVNDGMMTEEVLTARIMPIVFVQLSIRYHRQTQIIPFPRLRRLVFNPSVDVLRLGHFIVSLSLSCCIEQWSVTYRTPAQLMSTYPQRIMWVRLYAIYGPTKVR